jgi:hypothetical protein
MKDTSPEMESRFNEMIMKKSGEERLKMGFSMFDMARRQIMASVIMNKPDADIKYIRKEIFLRLYSEEFSKKEQERILTRIL